MEKLLKTWYRVSTYGGGWCKFETIDELIKYRSERVNYYKIKKIIKVTEEVLGDDIVTEVNSYGTLKEN